MEPVRVDVTTDAHDVEAVIVQSNDHVVVEIVGVGLDQPHLGDAERLATHVAQQTLGALDVYLHDDVIAALDDHGFDVVRVRGHVDSDRFRVVYAERRPDDRA